MIYTQGTLSTVSGSAIVRGTGTKFKDNLNGIASGQVILIQSGSSNLLHMIQAVNSDTELVLADNAKTTLNNVTYQIQTTVPNSISDGVRHMCAINSNIIQFLQNMDKWMTQNSVVNVTLPNGQTVSLQSIKALQAVVNDSVSKTSTEYQYVTGEIRCRYANGVYSQDGKNSLLLSLARGIPDMYVAANGSSYRVKIPDTGGQLALTSEPNFVKKNETFMQELKSELNVTQRLSAVAPNASTIRMYCFDNGRAGLGYRNKEGVWLGDHELPKTGNGGTLMSTAQYYADGTGVVRKSSPIIQIYPTGKFTTNDESEGATVSKPGLGHYQVTGVLGYNADGAWGVHGGISSPKNNNGLELIYIDDKVNKDGSITIETFHRQHSHLPVRFQNKRIKAIVNGEKVYYQEGEPCDIPEGCRLDVRAQMPENSVWNVKQQAAEVVTDIEPPESVK